jgi:threonine/homoserine/homoserine lactone efflux protein
MVLTAALIDASWYMLVVLTLSHSRILEILRGKAGQLDKVFGLLLVLLAVRVFSLS